MSGKNSWATRTLIVGLASLTVLLAPIGPAQAAASVIALPDDPGTLTVGQTGVPIALVVKNLSTAPENTLTFTVDSLKLAPSCVGFSMTACATTELGVFGTSPSGTGRAGSACAAQIFPIGPADASGVATVTLTTPIVLGPPGSPTEQCTIDFTVNVLKMPVTDARLDLDGVQTNMVGFVHAVSGAINFNTGSGRAITIVRDTPTLTSIASPGVRQGGLVFDTATLGNGTNPTGSLTFALYGPNDTTCANPPVFTSPVAVTGNGNYQSGTHAPTAPGTYRWRVSYSGDANNNPLTGAAATLCSDPNEDVFVSPGTPGDYDNDHDADLAVFRPSTNTWFIRGGATVVWGATNDIPVPADYDGNGATDVAVYRPSTGVWYVLNQFAVAWGTTEDIPVPGDYDGDGKADLAVYRQSNNTWYLRTTTPQSITWGAAGDVPVPGDYDGDGKFDIAVFRPSTNTWYLRYSTFGPDAVVWGANGDIPAPADYNADGITDLAVFRPGISTWYLRTTTPSAVFWGASGDMPVPGDYDGDADADAAVYRPSTGVWYVFNGIVTQWGVPGDIPVPIPYAIRHAFFP